MANGTNQTGSGSVSGAQQDADGWQAQMQDRINRLSHQVQDQSNQLTEMAESGIREWPVSSVVGALAIGLAVGFVLGRSS